MDSKCNGKSDVDLQEKEPMTLDANQNRQEPRHGRTDCGWFSCRPEFLHRFNSPRWLLLLLCCYNILHGCTTNGLTNVSITSIERRFELPSSRSGLIPPTYDIVAAFVIVLVAFLGSEGSKPRWLACGMFTLGVASLTYTIPHFATGTYKYGQDDEDTTSSGVCVRDSKNWRQNETDFCTSTQQNSITALSQNFYFFIVAQILYGIGAPALYSLGVTLLDESVSKRKSGFYIGIFSACTIIGPAVGFIIGSIFLKFFTDFLTVDESSLTIDTSSPQWVGAWWLGNLFTATMMFILVIPLSCLPPQLKGTRDVQSQRESQVFEDADKYAAAVARSKKGFGVKFHHLPRAVYSILTNSTFMLITICSAADGLFIGGAEVFLPKYLETQFGLSASFAAMQIGIYLVLFGGGGLVAAGWVIKHFSLNIPGMLKVCLVTSFVCMMGMFGQLLSCDEIPLAGVQVSYAGNKAISSRYSDLSLGSECNADCSCGTEQFIPVCGTHNNITYFSPCHAGCTAYDKETQVYSNCSCIAETLVEADQPSTSKHGLCGKRCWQYYTYCVLLAIVMCTLLMNGTFYLNIVLRCVPDYSRDYALGIYGFIVRVFGSCAGPILFGQLIDDTCIIWHHECGQRGRCWAYNRYEISLYMLLIGVSVKVFTVGLFSLAAYIYKPPIERHKLST